MKRAKTSKEKFYLKADNDISDELKELGIKSNPKSIAIIRGMYFNGKNTIPGIHAHVSRKALVSEEPAKKGQWKAAQTILESMDSKTMPVLLRVMKFKE